MFISTVLIILCVKRQKPSIYFDNFRGVVYLLTTIFRNVIFVTVNYHFISKLLSKMCGTFCVHVLIEIGIKSYIELL
jgi:hypothetical protein